MRDYIIRRILIGIATLFVVSIVVFLLVRVMGDPAQLMIEPGASPQDIQALRVRWGLDRPLIIQYAIFVSNALKGDFGRSIIYREPNFDLYKARLPESLKLVVTAFAIAILFGVAIGVLSALSVGGFYDTFGKLFAFLGLAIPNFWLGLMLIMLFAVHWRIFPVAGSGGFKQFVLPALTLAWYMTAAFVRLTRSSLLEVLGSDHIKFNRVTGIPEILVVAKHALRNALIPVVTYAGVQLAVMVNGAFIVEIVFNLPGTGLLLYDGIVQRDYPLVQTVVIITAGLVVFTNLLVDIIYAYLDPRIRLK